MVEERFRFRVTGGWLRDLASQPVPGKKWPVIDWDEQLFLDQKQFLELQAELDITYNLVWGLFASRSWQENIEETMDKTRQDCIKRFVDEAHSRGIKVLAGVGIYSWGFDEIIKNNPGLSDGNTNVMCGSNEEAWNWQRRVLDFVINPKWKLDGISMQSADQGRCRCSRCQKYSDMEYHYMILSKSVDYVKTSRPEWTIGYSFWGLDITEEDGIEYLIKLSEYFSYIIEVKEISYYKGFRKELIEKLKCSFGSVGGVFVEPPQHWERLRWFLPCGLNSARALKQLYNDGGRACEYYYRPIVNPVEEVSWRTGAKILSFPDIEPEASLKEAISRVYSIEGKSADDLTEWFIKAENVYFKYSNFKVGDGPVSLEPLIWKENPSESGPPVYLTERMSVSERRGYAEELLKLQRELKMIDIPQSIALERTFLCIESTLKEVSLFV